jgi:protein-tyrosine phosphatase
LIDIHSHILWGLDDGARECDDSIAMLRIAAEFGTTDIVATPHSDPRYAFQPDVMNQRIAQLTSSLSGIPRIHKGCDFHLSFENIQDALAFPSKYTINGLGYLLVELAEAFIPRSSDEILRQFVQRGIVPVITHPERNFLLRRDLARLEKWVNFGCVVQITAQSLGDRFGKQAKRSAWSMLKKGLVHVVASDAHDVKHRPPRLDIARSALTQEIGAAAATLLLVENPAAILTGAPIRPMNTAKRWSVVAHALVRAAFTLV